MTLDYAVHQARQDGYAEGYAAGQKAATSAPPDHAALIEQLEAVKVGCGSYIVVTAEGGKRVSDIAAAAIAALQEEAEMKDSKICPRCDGRGTVVKVYDEYGIADPKDVRCPTCEGSGRVRPA